MRAGGIINSMHKLILPKQVLEKSLDGRYDGKYNGISSVEISKIFATKDDLCERRHLVKDRYL